MEGKTSLIFEETNIAQWIFCVLNDKVDKLIVCHPAYLPRKSGPKNDYRDAAHLAIQLRAGNYTNVFYEDSPLMYLRTVINPVFSVDIWSHGAGNDINYLLGNVGIGTASPTTKLEGAGSIKPGGVSTGGSCSFEGAFAFDF